MPENKYKVLYVEDDKTNRLVFEATFKKKYDLLIAESGMEGLQILEKEEVDVIITDYRMPGMTGVEFLQEVQKKYPGPNRIMLTAYSNFETMEEAINLGQVYQYVLKPWRRDILGPIIDKAIEGYHLRRENERLTEKLSAKTLQLEQEVKEKDKLLDEVRLSQKELKFSEQRFKDISFSMAGWVWEIDKNWKYTFAAGRVKELSGYEADELIGKTPFDFMPKEEAERVEEIFSEIMKAQIPFNDLKNWNIRKDGKKVCFSTNGVPLIDDSGGLYGYRGVDIDVSGDIRINEEIKKLNEELEGKVLKRTEELNKEKNLTKAILESLPGIFYAFDEQGKFNFWNKNFEEVFGYTSEEIRNIEVVDTIVENEREKVAAAVGRVFTNGYDVVEAHILTKHGKKIPYFLTGKLFINEGIKYLVGTSVDLTELKNTQIALSESHSLIKKIVEHLPSLFLLVIEKDLTVGFSAGQELMNPDNDTNHFDGITITDIFGSHQENINSYYKKTFSGSECTFELEHNKQSFFFKTVPLFNSGNSVERILVIIENLRWRK